MVVAVVVVVAVVIVVVEVVVVEVEVVVVEVVEHVVVLLLLIYDANRTVISIILPNFVNEYDSYEYITVMWFYIWIILRDDPLFLWSFILIIYTIYAKLYIFVLLITIYYHACSMVFSSSFLFPVIYTKCIYNLVLKYIVICLYLPYSLFCN